MIIFMRILLRKRFAFEDKQTLFEVRLKRNGMLSILAAKCAFSTKLNVLYTIKKNEVVDFAYLPYELWSFGKIIIF